MGGRGRKKRQYKGQKTRWPIDIKRKTRRRRLRQTDGAMMLTDVEVGADIDVGSGAAIT